MSVVLSNVNGGSLQTLVKSVGVVPEESLKTIMRQALTALHNIHSKHKSAHQGVKISQILLTNDAQGRLSLGLSKRELNDV